MNIFTQIVGLLSGLLILGIVSGAVQADTSAAPAPLVYYGR